MYRLKELVTKLKEHRDKLLIGWLFFGSSYKDFYLINKTFLIIAGIFKGQPKAFRIPGAVNINPIEDFVEYTGDTVRILNGPRRGILININKVREDEVISRVGLIKQLRSGKKAHLISNNRDGDLNFMDTLTEFYRKAEDADYLEYPDIYIAVRPEQEKRLRLRRYAERSGDPIKNVVPEKILYSYDKYYGKGVCVARKDPELKPKWISADVLATADTQSLKIDLIEYMNDFGGNYDT